MKDYGLFKNNCEGTVLLTGEANIFYFTGFYTTARRPKQIGYTAVILGEGVKIFLIPEKWRLQVEEQELPDTGKVETYANTKEAYRIRLKELLSGMDLRKLWVEDEELDIPSYRMLTALAGKILDVTGRAAAIRLIKSPEEIKKLRCAADTAVQAMEYAKSILVPGMSELEAVAAIEYQMRKNGSDGVPFTMKILSGERSSIVTRVPGKKELEKGDLVLIDFGAKCGGYSSDWTRTFCLGKATEEQQAMYDLVWKMERECISIIKPGLPMYTLMDKAYETAEGHPYGRYFNPHLGHSVGITSHEWPVIEPGVTETIRENMVITIEPGVYIPGFGGVRIEDEILVTSSGYEILTGLSSEGLSLE